MAPTETKEGPVRRLTLPVGSAERGRGEEGFTLLEVICVVAIIAMIAAIILPALPRGTSRARLEAYAVETAAMLKADRNAAMRRRVPIVTAVDATERSVRSGATGRLIRLPEDVKFDALLSARCNRRAAGSTIQFFASGMSCGGVIALSRLGTGYEVRVHWLTGGVEVVPLNTL
jgi:general secretion pathway protein H